MDAVPQEQPIHTVSFRRHLRASAVRVTAGPEWVGAVDEKAGRIGTIRIISTLQAHVGPAVTEGACHTLPQEYPVPVIANAFRGYIAVPGFRVAARPYDRVAHHARIGLLVAELFRRTRITTRYADSVLAGFRTGAKQVVVAIRIIVAFRAFVGTQVNYAGRYIARALVIWHAWIIDEPRATIEVCGNFGGHHVVIPGIDDR